MCSPLRFVPRASLQLNRTTYSVIHIVGLQNTYVTALYKMAATCNFGTMADTLIKDRLVIWIRNVKATENLLERNNLHLETCIGTCIEDVTDNARISDLPSDFIRLTEFPSVSRKGSRYPGITAMLQKLTECSKFD